MSKNLVLFPEASFWKSFSPPVEVIVLVWALGRKNKKGDATDKTDVRQLISTQSLRQWSHSVDLSNVCRPQFSLRNLVARIICLYV